VACSRWLRIPDPASAALRLPVRQVGELAAARRADELTELLGLQALRYQLIGELSTGQRRLVDIGCVLAHAPQVILLDEPSSGVAQREAEALVPVIKDLRAQLDATIVVVEHDMAIATALADRMVALDLGRVITDGAPEEVLRHPHVVEAYLGRRAPHDRNAGTRPTTPQGASKQ
jgi:branched-chain amino acid transport system ATP-binding protein